MKRSIGLVAILAVLVSVPVFAQQSGITLESLSARIETLVAGQQYVLQRVAALETTVAVQAQPVVMVVTSTPIPSDTPIPPSPTPSYTPIPTQTPEPTATATRKPTATTRPTPTLAPSVTPTPTPASERVTADRRLSLRRGPGTSHGVIAYVERNSQFDIIGRNLAGSWIQVSYDEEIGWLPARYADGVSSIPIVATPTPLPSPTPADTSTPVPTPTIEKVTEELWDRLKEAARKDSEGAQPDKELTQEEISAVLSNYFTVLSVLRRKCDMTRMELLDLVEPHAQRIDESGISVKTGYWARWSLLNGMKTYLEDNEADCSEYIADYAAWVIAKYGNDQ